MSVPSGTTTCRGGPCRLGAAGRPDWLGLFTRPDLLVLYGRTVRQVPVELGRLRPIKGNGHVSVADERPSQQVALGVLTGYVKVTRDLTARRERGELLRRQRDEILELSTPVIQVWDKVVALPIIGDAGLGAGGPADRGAAALLHRRPERGRRPCQMPRLIASTVADVPRLNAGFGEYVKGLPSQ